MAGVRTNFAKRTARKSGVWANPHLHHPGSQHQVIRHRACSRGPGDWDRDPINPEYHHQERFWDTSNVSLWEQKSSRSVDHDANYDLYDGHKYDHGEYQQDWDPLNSANDSASRSRDSCGETRAKVDAHYSDKDHDSRRDAGNNIVPSDCGHVTRPAASLCRQSADIQNDVENVDKPPNRTVKPRPPSQPAFVKPRPSSQPGSVYPSAESGRENGVLSRQRSTRTDSVVSDRIGGVSDAKKALFVASWEPKYVIAVANFRKDGFRHRIEPKETRGKTSHVLSDRTINKSQSLLERTRKKRDTGMLHSGVMSSGKLLVENSSTTAVLSGPSEEKESLLSGNGSRSIAQLNPHLTSHPVGTESTDVASINVSKVNHSKRTLKKSAWSQNEQNAAETNKKSKSLTSEISPYVRASSLPASPIPTVQYSNVQEKPTVRHPSSQLHSNSSRVGQMPKPPDLHTQLSKAPHRSTLLKDESSKFLLFPTIKNAEMSKELVQISLEAPHPLSIQDCSDELVRSSKSSTRKNLSSNTCFTNCNGRVRSKHDKKRKDGAQFRLPGMCLLQPGKRKSCNSRSSDWRLTDKRPCGDGSYHPSQEPSKNRNVTSTSKTTNVSIKQELFQQMFGTPGDYQNVTGHSRVVSSGHKVPSCSKEIRDTSRAKMQVKKTSSNHDEVRQREYDVPTSLSSVSALNTCNTDAVTYEVTRGHSRRKIRRTSVGVDISSSQQPDSTSIPETALRISHAATKASTSNDRDKFTETGLARFDSGDTHESLYQIDSVHKATIHGTKCQSNGSNDLPELVTLTAVSDVSDFNCKGSMRASSRHWRTVNNLAEISDRNEADYETLSVSAKPKVKMEKRIADNTARLGKVYKKRKRRLTLLSSPKGTRRELTSVFEPRLKLSPIRATGACSTRPCFVRLQKCDNDANSTSSESSRRGVQAYNDNMENTKAKIHVIKDELICDQEKGSGDVSTTAVHLDKVEEHNSSSAASISHAVTELSSKLVGFSADTRQIEKSLDEGSKTNQHSTAKLSMTTNMKSNELVSSSITSKFQMISELLGQFERRAQKGDRSLFSSFRPMTETDRLADMNDSYLPNLESDKHSCTKTVFKPLVRMDMVKLKQILSPHRLMVPRNNAMKRSRSIEGTDDLMDSIKRIKRLKDELNRGSLSNKESASEFSPSQSLILKNRDPNIKSRRSLAKPLFESVLPQKLSETNKPSISSYPEDCISHLPVDNDSRVAEETFPMKVDDVVMRDKEQVTESPNVAEARSPLEACVTEEPGMAVSALLQSLDSFHRPYALYRASREATPSLLTPESPVDAVYICESPPKSTETVPDIHGSQPVNNKLRTALGMRRSSLPSPPPDTVRVTTSDKMPVITSTSSTVVPHGTTHATCPIVPQDSLLRNLSSPSNKTLANNSQSTNYGNHDSMTATTDNIAVASLKERTLTSVNAVKSSDLSKVYSQLAESPLSIRNYKTSDTLCDALRSAGLGTLVANQSEFDDESNEVTLISSPVSLVGKFTNHSTSFHPDVDYTKTAVINCTVTPHHQSTPISSTIVRTPGSSSGSVRETAPSTTSVIKVRAMSQFCSPPRPQLSSVAPVYLVPTMLPGPGAMPPPLAADQVAPRPGVAAIAAASRSASGQTLHYDRQNSYVPQFVERYSSSATSLWQNSSSQPNQQSITYDQTRCTNSPEDDMHILRTCAPPLNKDLFISQGNADIAPGNKNLGRNFVSDSSLSGDYRRQLDNVALSPDINGRLVRIHQNFSQPNATAADTNAHYIPATHSTREYVHPQPQSGPHYQRHPLATCNTSATDVSYVPSDSSFFDETGDASFLQKMYVTSRDRLAHIERALPACRGLANTMCLDTVRGMDTVLVMHDITQAGMYASHATCHERSPAIELVQVPPRSLQDKVTPCNYKRNDAINVIHSTLSDSRSNTQGSVTKPNTVTTSAVSSSTVNQNNRLPSGAVNEAVASEPIGVIVRRVNTHAQQRTQESPSSSTDITPEKVKNVSSAHFADVSAKPAWQPEPLDLRSKNDETNTALDLSRRTCSNEEYFVGFPLRALPPPVSGNKTMSPSDSCVMVSGSPQYRSCTTATHSHPIGSTPYITTAISTGTDTRTSASTGTAGLSLPQAVMFAQSRPRPFLRFSPMAAQRMSLNGKYVHTTNTVARDVLPRMPPLLPDYLVEDATEPYQAHKGHHGDWDFSERDKFNTDALPNTGHPSLSSYREQWQSFEGPQENGYHDMPSTTQSTRTLNSKEIVESRLQGVYSPMSQSLVDPVYHPMMYSNHTGAVPYSPFMVPVNNMAMYPPMMIPASQHTAGQYTYPAQPFRLLAPPTQPPHLHQPQKCPQKKRKKKTKTSTAREDVHVLSDVGCTSDDSQKKIQPVYSSLKRRILDRSTKDMDMRR